MKYKTQAIGMLGGAMGVVAGLLFLVVATAEVALDDNASRSDEAVIGLVGLGLLVLAVVGLTGAVRAGTDVRSGTVLQIVAAIGGPALFLALALADAGLADTPENYVTDAVWLATGFWALPSILFLAGAVFTRPMEA